MSKNQFDLIIIGGGSGGITAAVLAAGLGKKVAMVDKTRFGGECTWTGCVPSKALLKAARAVHTVRDLGKFGIKVPGKLSLDLSRVMKSVDDIVKSVYEGETVARFKKMGITAVENAAVVFVDNHTVQVNNKKMTADKFIIATGSSPFVPPVPKLETVSYLTNETVFSIKKLPRSLVVMGGGPIGVELASAFNRLGVKVTLVEMADVILFREDRELSQVVADMLEKEGLTVLTGAKVIEAVRGKRPALIYKHGGRKKKISTDAILVAAGRQPNVTGLGLEKLGIAYDTTGITVNQKLETTVRNIYAVGDVVGPYQFSHMANTEAIIAASNALLPVNKKCDYRHVPWITFTDPELARSGLTERDARHRYGNSVKIFKSEYADTDRGRTDRATEGFAKVICKRDCTILGIHIVGSRAGELMQHLHLAKSLGIPLDRLNSVIYAYPGYSDIIKNLARQAYIDRLNSNLLVKLVKFFSGKK